MNITFKTRSNVLRPVAFGMIGVIDRSKVNEELRREVQELAAGFENTPETVLATWSGDQIAAITYQHREDALTAPGAYEYDIPEAGSCQGVIQGHFFSGFEAIAVDDQRPRSISHAMVSRYADEGLGTLAQLNGGWIAIVLDRERQRAIFARDAVGFETLYVATLESQIVFASDLRALRRAGLATEYDEQTALEFLHYLYVPSPRTVYQGILSVLPGHALIIDPHGICQECFAPPRFVQGLPLGDSDGVQSAMQEYLPSFEEWMFTAAESCVPQQGRIGLLFSAGKDSSALAIAVKEVAPDRVVALTVSTQDPRSDESNYAARMCDFLGIPHRIYKPKPDELIPGFQKLVACQDQPMGDPASLPLFLALSDFPEDVSVVWDGTGSDFYFGSVHAADKHRFHRRLQLERVVPSFAWPLFLWLMQRGPARFASTARDWSRPLGEAFSPWNGWTQEELERLCQREVDWSDTYLWQLIRSSAGKDWLTLKSEVVGKVETPNAFLRKTVYAARAAGLAVRLPLIDNRLAEFANGLPQELQHWKYTNKTLARAYLFKHLPKDLVQRPKGDFVSDHNVLVQSRNGRLLRWLKESGLWCIFPSWSSEYLDAVLSEYRNRPEGYVDKMYALSLLSLWMAMDRGHISWDALSRLNNHRLMDFNKLIR